MEEQIEVVCKGNIYIYNCDGTKEEDPIFIEGNTYTFTPRDTCDRLYFDGYSETGKCTIDKGVMKRKFKVT